MANVKNNASAKETKRRLIDAAGEVFAEHGFERATIKEITDRAGASLAAVNYHFSDKQELYDQVVQHVHEHGASVFRAVTDRTVDLTPEQRLREFITRLLTHVLDPQLPRWYSQIKSREMQKPSEVTENYIDRVFCPFVYHLESLVGELVGRPVPPVQLTRLTHSVIGQILFYSNCNQLEKRLHPNQPQSTESIPELAEHITRFTLAALSCWK